jgi:hypothetical protein
MMWTPLSQKPARKIVFLWQEICPRVSKRKGHFADEVCNLIGTWEYRLGGNMGTQVAQASIAVASVCTPDDVERLVRLFERIAAEEGWETGGQLRVHTLTAVHFAVFVEGELAGGLQLVHHGTGSPLPCFGVWPELACEVSPDAAEVALLALRHEYRGANRLFRPLSVEVWRYCRHHGITELWAEVTPANLRIYRRFGWTFEVRGPLRPHWGEDCYPCQMRLDEAEAAFRKEAEQSSWRRELLPYADRLPTEAVVAVTGERR